MPVLTVDRGYYSGVKASVQANPYVAPSYATRDRCWYCGRFVTGPRVSPRRQCDRCQVVWYKPPPRGTELFAESHRQQALKTFATRFLFRPGEEWSDAFDTFIDHGETQLCCPA